MAARAMGLISLLLCLFLVPCTGQAVTTSDAAEPISTRQECTLTLIYGSGDTRLEDLEVSLYQIASVSADAIYTPGASFDTAGLVLNGVRSVGEWDMIRSTLDAYILANALKADETAATDQDGQILFPDLEPGLYLITSGYGEQDGWQYFFDSALVALPGLDEHGLWQYAVTVTPKPGILPPVTPDETVEWKVLKLWKGGTSRPNSVKVEIFRDGKSQKTVTLSESNHWSYSWTAPKYGADWSVVERNIPKGYTMTLEQRGTSFVLTNQYQDSTYIDGPKTGDTSHILFYTGLMYTSGILLVLLGLAGKRKQK